jgi:hypothetical protein
MVQTRIGVVDAEVLPFDGGDNALGMVELDAAPDNLVTLRAKGGYHVGSE